MIPDHAVDLVDHAQPMAGRTLDARALVIALSVGEQLQVASKLDAPHAAPHGHFLRVLQRQTSLPEPLEQPVGQVVGVLVQPV